MLLSKKVFSFKINKLSTRHNIYNGMPSDILYTGYLNKEISFGGIIYFEQKNIQYQSSDILQHSQNRPTGDRWLKL